MQNKKFIVKINLNKRQKYVICEASCHSEAAVKVSKQEDVSTSEIHSVVSTENATIVEVPEKHPRHNWKCFRIEEWPDYKADLNVTNPKETLMVSCFDPTVNTPESVELFGSIILKKIESL